MFRNFEVLHFLVFHKSDGSAPGKGEMFGSWTTWLSQRYDTDLAELRNEMNVEYKESLVTSQGLT